MARPRKQPPISLLDKRRGHQDGPLHRREALYRVKKLLKKTPKSPTAIQLITLFNLEAEELTEAGVDYEVVRSLAQYVSRLS